MLMNHIMLLFRQNGIEKSLFHAYSEIKDPFNNLFK